MNLTTKDIAFAKHTSTVFAVGSPLQLLCAIEFEREFEVGDCLYIIVLRPGWVRNEQLLSMANSFKLKYITVTTEELSYEAMCNNVGYFNGEGVEYKYDRIVCDFHDTYNYCASYKYANQGAQIVYIDDGNATIALLEGKSDVPKPTILRKKIALVSPSKET